MSICSKLPLRQIIFFDMPNKLYPSIFYFTYHKSHYSDIRFLEHYVIVLSPTVIMKDKQINLSKLTLITIAFQVFVLLYGLLVSLLSNSGSIYFSRLINLAISVVIGVAMALTFYRTNKYLLPKKYLFIRFALNAMLTSIYLLMIIICFGQFISI